MKAEVTWYVIFVLPSGRKTIHWADTTRAKARRVGKAAHQQLIARGSVSPFKVLITRDRSQADW